MQMSKRGHQARAADLGCTQNPPAAMQLCLPGLEILVLVLGAPGSNWVDRAPLGFAIPAPHRSLFLWGTADPFSDCVSLGAPLLW